MYQEKIIVEDAVPFSPIVAECDPDADAASLGDRLVALLIIAAVPFMLVAFLVRFVWSDVMTIGRGLRSAFRVVTEEVARKP